MMLFNNLLITDVGPPVTNEMLFEFEEHLPRPLPTDYRKFLMRYNGGAMDENKNAFFIYGIPGYTESKPGEEGFVDSFDSLLPGKSEDGWDLLSQYLFFSKKGVFPDCCLPIGSDCGGNLILLSLGEKDYGHVYFWEHEEGWDEAGSLEPNISYCYFVANSFGEFVDSIHSDFEEQS